MRFMEAQLAVRKPTLHLILYNRIGGRQHIDNRIFRLVAYPAYLRLHVARINELE